MPFYPNGNVLDGLDSESGRRKVAEEEEERGQKRLQSNHPAA